MTFQWPRGEVSCLRKTVLGRDINVDAFSARDSAFGNSYPSKSYHSHAGSQWVFLQVEVRSNMEGLMLLNLRLLQPVWATSWPAHLSKKLEVKCIMLYAVRFGPMSGLPFWHHVSQISFSLSHFNLLVGDTLTHFVLGDCGLAVSLCNTTFLPISPALPP